MSFLSQKRWRDLSWGMMVSVALHVVVAGALLFRFWPQSVTPEEPEVIKVALVPPPQEPAKKPEPKKPEPTKTEPKKPEEPKAVKKPPEPKAAQPEEIAKAGQPTSLPVFRPVFQFGDKDAGPAQSDKGHAAQEQKADGDTAEGSPPETPAKTDNSATDLLAASLLRAKTTPLGLGDMPAPKPDDTSAKDDLISGFGMEKPVSDAQADVKPKEPSTPDRRPKAKTLFSQNKTNDLMATVAMDNLPRPARAGQLCQTELREQLNHASPPHPAERLPTYHLAAGNVLDVKTTGAFRSRGQWYRVSFRCEVDDDAHKVMSFAFSVGEVIPVSEVERRRLPQY